MATDKPQVGVLMGTIDGTGSADAEAQSTERPEESKPENSQNPGGQKGGPEAIHRSRNGNSNGPYPDFKRQTDLSVWVPVAVHFHTFPLGVLRRSPSPAIGRYAKCLPPIMHLPSVHLVSQRRNLGTILNSSLTATAHRSTIPAALALHGAKASPSPAQQGRVQCGPCLPLIFAI